MRTNNLMFGLAPTRCLWLPCDLSLNPVKSHLTSTPFLINPISNQSISPNMFQSQVSSAPGLAPITHVFCQPLAVRILLPKDLSPNALKSRLSLTLSLINPSLQCRLRVVLATKRINPTRIKPRLDSRRVRFKRTLVTNGSIRPATNQTTRLGGS
jgi:hypothetical protein